MNDRSGPLGPRHHTTPHQDIIYLPLYYRIPPPFSSPVFSLEVDTDKHDSQFELETLERNLDSMERAMETKKHWHVSDRAHMKNMLSSARVTDEAFHEETDDDGTFRTSRFTGKVCLALG